MQNLEDKKVAIVCDWIKDWGGAEIVLAQFLEIFPNADIFTSIFFPPKNKNYLFKNKITDNSKNSLVKPENDTNQKGRKIFTSFIQRIPFLNKSHKLALILRPRAFESFDLSDYDIVISSSSAESKGVITKPETLQICYCHTPTRYFWSHYHEYINMMEFGILNFIGKWLMPKIVHKLRQWDFVASQRPDFFIANSENTKSRIKKYYGREANVIYPCLDIANIPFNEKKKDYYFYNGRCIPYKKFDLVVLAFNENGKPLKIATNTENKLSKDLQKISKSNIEWIFTDDINLVNKLHSEAKAFLFPPEEDFGLVPIAAMATGTPVIAFGKGGALETIIKGETGIFFEEQSISSLNNTIKKFEKINFNAKKIRKHAEKFDKNTFKKKILEFTKEKYYEDKTKLEYRI